MSQSNIEPPEVAETLANNHLDNLSESAEITHVSEAEFSVGTPMREVSPNAVDFAFHNGYRVASVNNASNSNEHELEVTFIQR